MITRQHRDESRTDHLLREWQECTRRAAHAYTLSRLRILEGNRGAAIFYQLEAAKYHRYAVAVRATIAHNARQSIGRGLRVITRTAKIIEFIPRTRNYTAELLNPTDHPD